MFKNLKKKLEQGVAQSPLRAVRLSLGKDDEDSAQPDQSGDGLQGKSDQSEEQTPRNTEQSESIVDAMVAQPTEAAVGQLIDIPLQDGSDASQQKQEAGNDSDQDPPTPTRSLSRHSSISSLASESALFPQLSFMSHSYQPPSDIESQSEFDESGFTHGAYSKEDLFQMVQKYQHRFLRYKAKFREVADAYRDLHQEKEKIKSTLTQSQDRAFRRIAELKEQSTLDRFAKKDLEDNYMLLLDERKEHIHVLQTQVRLLKDGKEIPAELEKKINTAKKSSSQSVPRESTPDSQEIVALQEKLKRLEGLLSRCKETIKSNKEKSINLQKSKDELQNILEWKDSEIERLKAEEGSRVNDALTEKAIAIAEAKRQMHEEIERKDEELHEVRTSCMRLQEENTGLQEHVEKLQKSEQEKVDKAREIIKKLKDEKRLILSEMDEKVKEAEQNMEEEKASLVQELSRGKMAAIALMKDEADKQFQELRSSQDAALQEARSSHETAMVEVRSLHESAMQDTRSSQEADMHEVLLSHEAALREHESIWQSKNTALEEAHKASLLAKEHELDRVLKQKTDEIQQHLHEKENESRLAIEERELHKMAALSQLDARNDDVLRQMEELRAVKIGLENQLAQHTDDQQNCMARMGLEKQEILDTYQGKITALQEASKKAIAELRGEHERALHEKTEQLVQLHASQIEELAQTHENTLSGSNDELEIYYKSKMDLLKENFETVMKEKTSHLETIASQSAELSKRLEDMTEEIAAKVCDYERKISGLETSYSESQLSLEVMSNDVVALKTELSQRVDLSGKQQEQVTALLEENQQAKTEIAHLQQEREELSIKVQALEENLNHLSDSAVTTEGNLCDKVCDLSEKLSEADGARQLMADKFDQSTAECDRLQANIDSKAHQYNELLTLKESLEQRQEELTKLLEKSERDITEAKALCTNLNGKVQDLENTLASKSAEFIGTLEKRDAVCEATVQERLATMVEMTTSMSARIEEETNKTAAASARVQALELALKDTEAQEKELQEKYQNLELNVQEKSAISAENSESLKKMQEKFGKFATEAKRRIKELRQNAEDSAKEYEEKIIAKEKSFEETLSCKNAELEAVREQIIKQEVALTEKDQTNVESIEAKETKISLLREKVNDLVQQLESNKSSFSDTLQAKEAELNELNTSLEHVNNEKVAVEERLVGDIDDLKGKMHEMTEGRAEQERIKNTLLEEKQKNAEEIQILTSNFEETLRMKEVTMNENVNGMLLRFESEKQDIRNTLSDQLQGQLTEKSDYEHEISNLKLSCDECLSVLVEEHGRAMADLEKSHQDKISVFQLQQNSALENMRSQNSEYIIAIDENKCVIEHLSAELACVKEESEKTVDDLREEMSKLHEESMVLLDTQRQEYTRTLEQEKISSEEEKQYEITSLKSELESAMLKLDESVKAESDFHSTINKLNVDLSEAVIQANSLQQQINNSYIDIDSLNVNLQDRNLENDSLKDQLKLESEKSSNFENSVINLNEKLKQIECDHEQRINDLVQQIGQSGDSAANLEKVYQTEIAELKTKFESQIAEFELAVHEKNLACESQHIELEQLRNTVKEAESQHIELGQLRNTVTEAESQHIELKQLRNTVTEAESEHIELEQLRNTVTEAESLHREISDLKEKSEAHRSEKELVESEVEDLNIKLSDLQKKVENERLERDALLERVQRVQKKYESEQLEKDTLSERMQSLHGTNSELEERLSKAHLDNESLLKECNLIQSSVTELDAKCSQAELLITDLKASLQQSQQTNDEKDGELHKLNQVLDEQVQKASEFEMEVSHLENKMKELSEEHIDKLDKAEQNLSETRQQLEDLNTKCHELDSIIEEKTQKINVLERGMNEQCESVTRLGHEKEASVQRLEQTGLDLQKQIDQKVQHYSELVANVEKENAILKDDLCAIKASIETLHVEHAEKIQNMTEKLELDASNKIGDYKKKAELYLVQMKKQFKDDKQVYIDDHNSVIDHLKCNMDNLRLEVDTLKSEKESLISECDKQINDLKTDHLAVMSSRDDVCHEAVQKAESFEHFQSELQRTVEDLKCEKNILNEKLCELECEKLEVSRSFDDKFSLLEGEMGKLSKQYELLKRDKDNELEMLHRDYQLKFDQSRREYDEKLQELDSEHGSKVKTLVREMNITLAEKEKEWQENLDGTLGRDQQIEDRLRAEHRQVTEELYKDLQKKDKEIEEIVETHQLVMKDKENETKSRFAEFEDKITSLEYEMASERERHKSEIENADQEFRNKYEKRFQDVNASHREEVEALTQEWNQERKLSPARHVMTELDPVAPAQQELVVQNHLALTAIQSGSNSGDLLRQQVIQLTRQVENIKEKHRLEMAELRSQFEMRHNLAKPLVAPPGQRDLFSEFEPKVAEEIQNMELHILDLQSHISHLNEEVRSLRVSEKHSRQTQMASGLPESVLSHTPFGSPSLSRFSNITDVSVYTIEPTEMQYLRNIMYEYMLGKETKTLARVIATVLQFAPDQTDQIIEYEKARHESWLSYHL